VCCAVLCCAVLCCAVLCCAVLCCAQVKVVVRAEVNGYIIRDDEKEYLNIKVRVALCCNPLSLTHSLTD
jgi:hypothetical protein